MTDKIEVLPVDREAAKPFLDRYLDGSSLSDDRDEIEQAFARHRVEAGGVWRPIEEAPMNGDVVLVTGGNCGYWCPSIVSAVFCDGEWHVDQWESPDETLKPAHFMLPRARPRASE